MFLGLSLWYTLYYATTTFFQVSKTRILSNIINARCLLVRSNEVRKYDTITLRVGSSFLDSFFVVRLHNVLKYVIAMFHFRLSLWHTFIASELRYVSVQMVSFFDNVRITLNCGNCWNLWILNGSDVIKWSYFGYF